MVNRLVGELVDQQSVSIQFLFVAVCERLNYKEEVSHIVDAYEAQLYGIHTYL